ncbi:MAG TPA: hypothetical protein VD763_03555 [Candidatus Saccharimonadales bacterium]|nr:hypothetical protein [Candidatus Saccharimonadales bacterium]
MASLILGSVASVQAAGPDHSKLEAFTVDFAAGQSCAFATRWDFPAGGNELTFPVRENGDQLVRQISSAPLTVTNLESGESITLRGGGRIDQLFHADGSLDLFARGTLYIALFPEDEGGPGMYQYRGHYEVDIAADFTFTNVRFKGHVTDICAALT